MSQTTESIHEEPKKSMSSDELNEKELGEVSGGINPQPLPPCHKED